MLQLVLVFCTTFCSNVPTLSHDLYVLHENRARLITYVDLLASYKTWAKMKMECQNQDFLHSLQQIHASINKTGHVYTLLDQTEMLADVIHVDNISQRLIQCIHTGNFDYTSAYIPKTCAPPYPPNVSMVLINTLIDITEAINKYNNSLCKKCVDCVVFGVQICRCTGGNEVGGICDDFISTISIFIEPCQVLLKRIQDILHCMYYDIDLYFGRSHKLIAGENNDFYVLRKEMIYKMYLDIEITYEEISVYADEWFYKSSPSINVFASEGMIFLSHKTRIEFLARKLNVMSNLLQTLECFLICFLRYKAKRAILQQLTQLKKSFTDKFFCYRCNFHLPLMIYKVSTPK